MPGLIRGVARTTAVVGTAAVVSGRVNRHQQQKWNAQDQQAAQQAAPQEAQQAAPAAQPTGGMDDKLEQLKQLGSLHDSGVLTDAEFEAQKAKILG